MAVIVALSADCAEAKSLMRTFSISFDISSFTGTNEFTDIVFSVIVPVLSTQRTSTLARVSIHFMSCTRTLFIARRIALSARVVLARRKSPSGISPINAATIDCILALTVSPSTK